RGDRRAALGGGQPRDHRDGQGAAGPRRPSAGGDKAAGRRELMIDANGKPVTKQALASYLATYNQGVRGSKEFGALPRALVIICDNLQVGKTTYVKCTE